jgi:hypothetical protein
VQRCRGGAEEVQGCFSGGNIGAEAQRRCKGANMEVLKRCRGSNMGLLMCQVVSCCWCRGDCACDLAGADVQRCRGICACAGVFPGAEIQRCKVLRRCRSAKVNW